MIENLQNHALNAHFVSQDPDDFTKNVFPLYEDQKPRKKKIATFFSSQKSPSQYSEIKRKKFIWKTNGKILHGKYKGKIKENVLVVLDPDPILGPGPKNF